MTPDFAELCGLHAGDGTIYRTARSVVWELRGNLDEREFYEEHIIPLLARIGFVVTGHFRSGGKNGCYGVRCCKNKFIKLLTDAGFAIGKKTRSVHIPEDIMEGSQELKEAFIRGLFAADGSMYVDGRNYPLIEFASASQRLRDEVVLLLQQFGIKPYTWKYTPKQRGGPAYFLRLCGREKLQLFCSRIGLLNPKHRLRAAPFLERNV